MTVIFPTPRHCSFSFCGHDRVVVLGLLVNAQHGNYTIFRCYIFTVF